MSNCCLNLIYVNSYEKKIIDEINKRISNNINSEEPDKNFEYSVKFIYDYFTNLLKYSIIIIVCIMI